MMNNVIYQVKLDNFIRAEMDQFGQLHYHILADFVPTKYDVHNMDLYEEEMVFDKWNI